MEKKNFLLMPKGKTKSPVAAVSEAKVKVSKAVKAVKKAASGKGSKKAASKAVKTAKKSVTEAKKIVSKSMPKKTPKKVVKKGSKVAKKGSAPAHLRAWIEKVKKIQADQHISYKEALIKARGDKKSKKAKKSPKYCRSGREMIGNKCYPYCEPAPKSGLPRIRDPKTHRCEIVTAPVGLLKNIDEKDRILKNLRKKTGMEMMASKKTSSKKAKKASK